MRWISYLILMISMVTPLQSVNGHQESVSDKDPAKQLLARLSGIDSSDKDNILDQALANDGELVLAVLAQVVDRNATRGTAEEWQQLLNSDVAARSSIHGLVMLAAAPGREQKSAQFGAILTKQFTATSVDGVSRFLARMLGSLGNSVAVAALAASIQTDALWSDETIRSLGSISGVAAQQALISLMLDAPARWKPAIAQALSSRSGSETVIEVLEAALKEDDERVTLAALDALVALGAEAAMKPSIDLLLAADPDQKGARSQRVIELAQRLDVNHHEIYARNLLDALLLTSGVPEKRRIVATRLRQQLGSWKPLFDGSSSKGWIGHTDGYQFSAGEIQCTEGNGGNIYTEDQFDDFILRFEFKLSPGANNGLGLRTPSSGDAAYAGMEAQILDNSADKWANLKPYQYHGSIYGVVPARRGFQKSVGEWNQQEVRCDGRQVKIILNGHVIIDANLDSVSQGGTLDGRDHPGLMRASGHIGFLGHGDAVAFRNLRIQPLNRSADPHQGE
jgi:hypothetical protein